MEKNAFVAMLQRAGMNFEAVGDHIRILGTEYQFDSQGLLLTVGTVGGTRATESKGKTV